MIEKIYHTADWHLRNINRQEEFEESIDLFCEDIHCYNLPYENARIVVTGDLFETQDQISNEANLIMANTLRGLVEFHPLIINIGNHDLPKNRTRMDAISPIITAMNHPQIKYSKFSEFFADDNVIFVHYSFLDNFAVQIQNKIPNKTYIGLYHAPLKNCKNPLNPVFEKKMLEHSITIDLFSNCDVVLMGDIHYPQIIKGEGYNAYYCGSLYQQNFGEYVEHHGYGVLNLSDLTYEHKELKNSYGKYKIKLDSIEDFNLNFTNIKK